MKKKFLRGEITTAFTVSILLGLTLFSLASQYILLKRQSIKTKAAGAVASLDCIQKINDKNYLFFKGADPACKRDEISQGTYAWLVGDKRCVVDKPETCEPPQGFESGEKWCYYFDNSYQNSRCMVRDVSCDNASCFGSSAGSSGSESGRESGSGGGAAGSTSGPGVSNGCFSLKAEFEAKDEGDKKAFYAWVTFESNRGGDVKLEEAGQHVAGWNSFAGGSFTYDPNWSQHWRPGSWIAVGTLKKGESYTVFYRGILSGCNPQDVSLSCNLTHNNNASASVSGNGCSCRNCGGGSTPPSSTATPTPKPNQPPSNTSPNNTPTQSPTPTPKPSSKECEDDGGICAVTTVCSFGEIGTKSEACKIFLHDDNAKCCKKNSSSTNTSTANTSNDKCEKLDGFCVKGSTGCVESVEIAAGKKDCVSQGYNFCCSKSYISDDSSKNESAVYQTKSDRVVSCNGGVQRQSSGENYCLPNSDSYLILLPVLY